jgi:cytochrome c oxidase assembly protein Cox11
MLDISRRIGQSCRVTPNMGKKQLLRIARNYVFSVIVGFVAITYGSVPMYKMVSLVTDTVNNIRF